jgi:hypothetical protein
MYWPLDGSPLVTVSVCCVCVLFIIFLRRYKSSLDEAAKADKVAHRRRHSAMPAGASPRQLDVDSPALQQFPLARYVKYVLKSQALEFYFWNCKLNYIPIIANPSYRRFTK